MNPLIIATPQATTLTPVQRYLISLNSQQSRVTMRSNLLQIAKLLGYEDINTVPWAQLERLHVQALIEKWLRLNKAPATMRVYLSAIKGVCKEAWVQKSMSTDTYMQIKELRPPRGSRLPKGRALNQNEVRELLQRCEADVSCRGLRDSAILAVMVSCGLRRAELIGLRYEDLIYRECALKILGKGNKERLAYVPDFAWHAIERWIDEVRGTHNGPLFTRIRAGQDVTEHSLSATGLVKILEARRLHTTWVDTFSPHDLRRTFASRLLDQDVDLNTVKELMGHSSINTTQRYDHRGKQRLERAGRGVSY